ncbi:hypothetical protein HY031_01345 [Candidatus Gottesmanbacteria bacterium]|nr:hypothetical protein [Candidatus Gottesmanbacteria bacterium]
MLRGPDSVRGGEGLDALSAELERQAEIYRGLSVSKDVIMRLLTPRPDRLLSYVDIPVVTLGTSVDPNIQASFAQIEKDYDLSRGVDTAGGITFPEPRLIWMHDGSRYTKKSVEWVLRHVPQHTRPSTQIDGIALAIVHPDIHRVLRHHWIALPGTSVGSGSAPNLRDWCGGLKLRHDLVGAASPRWGSALSGS